MKKKIILFKTCQLTALLVLTLLALPVKATLQEETGGVSLAQTRVIFPENEKAVTIAIQNSSQQRFLVQSRVQIDADDGTAAPFLVTPPLFMLKAKYNQQLRILPQGAHLPEDRESLFYLSVLAIPAGSHKNDADSLLSMGIHFVLKLFYRPAGLPASSSGTACSLLISKVGQGVQIENPTPYFQTLASLTFNQQELELDKYPAMIAPKSQQHYPATKKVHQISWQTVNDYGGLSERCQRSLAL